MYSRRLQIFSSPGGTNYGSEDAAQQDQDPLVLLDAAASVSLAQDKGGPSKGGFLNNQVFSYTDLYLSNEINGMCI